MPVTPPVQRLRKCSIQAPIRSIDNCPKVSRTQQLRNMTLLPSFSASKRFPSTHNYLLVSLRRLTRLCAVLTILTILTPRFPSLMLFLASGEMRLRSRLRCSQFKNLDPLLLLEHGHVACLCFEASCLRFLGALLTCCGI